jgi:hypothetical protein
MPQNREVFAASEARFKQGKNLIVCAATRCLLKPPNTPPIGASAKDLLAWTIGIFHPSVAECVWGTGRTLIPWAIYFRSEQGIVIRGFHLHPLAFPKYKGLTFEGTSLDEHLIEMFTEEQTHVVTTPDELALAELSPSERVFRTTPEPFTEKTAFVWAQHRARPRHRWLFTHRIVISGTGENMQDIEPCETILKKLSYTSTEFYNCPTPKHFSNIEDPENFGCYSPNSPNSPMVVR